MAESIKEEEGWGLSSVSAAFSGWGLGSGGGEEPSKEAKEDDGEADAINKNLILSNEAEEVLDETAKAVATKAFGLFDDASKYVSDAVAQIDEAGGVGNAIDASSAKAEDQPDIVKDIQTSAYSTWSTMFDSKPQGNTAAETTTTDETTPPDKLDTMTSILQYNPLNSLASSWINDLQKESIANDPHNKFRTHLEKHLQDFPKSDYEMWVEEALTFAGDIAVVDDTFYRESSIHRNIWNEKMAELDPNVGGEGEEGGDEETSTSEWRSRYVPARPPRTKKVEETVPAVVSSSSPTKTTSDKKTTPKKVPSSSSTTTSIPKSDDDADLDNLLDDTALPPSKTPPKVTAASTTPNKSNPILEASALLDDEDADLDGLLGGDDDSSGEVVFVSSSPSC